MLPEPLHILLQSRFLTLQPPCTGTLYPATGPQTYCTAGAAGIAPFLSICISIHQSMKPLGWASRGTYEPS